MKKQIICFANSRKLNGLCFAGKDVESKQWIRPVSARKDNSLYDFEECISEKDCNYNCSNCKPLKPNLLDIIEIEINDNIGEHHQVENYLIKKCKWKKIGVLKSELIYDYLDNGNKKLWVDGYGAWHRKNDRIPIELGNEIKDSLRLIEVDNFKLIVTIEGADFGNPKKKVNGKFLFHNTEYIIPITDPVVEKKYLHFEEGEYSFQTDQKRTILSLSMGKEYNGYIYKFIAGVMLS